MKLTITTLTDTDLLRTLDVSPDMELENFKALLEYEVGFPSENMVIIHEGHPLLDDKKDLVTFGVKEGDVLLIELINLQSSADQLPNESINVNDNQLPDSALVHPSTATNFTPIQLTDSTPVDPPTTAPVSLWHPFSMKAESIMHFLSTNPPMLALLQKNNPSLAATFQIGNKDMFKKELNNQLVEWHQKQIEEMIRQDNVNCNKNAATEYHPELYSQITMLYINCKVNDRPVRALIDSGAEETIMSEACAEKCGIKRLIDRRWSGYTEGIGVQKVLGKIHLVNMQINDVFLQSSFSILEFLDVDMIFGLDMLKRHQCCIDLKKSVLVIGTTETETPFLNESELLTQVSFSD